MKWYYGSFAPLQSSTYNSWHKLTIVRNGGNSKVVFDGTQHSVTGSSVGSGLIRLGVYKATKEYFDDVRVRKWAGVDPSTTVGAEDVNPLPVELSSFSGSVIGSSFSTFFGVIFYTPLHQCYWFLCWMQNSFSNF